MGDAGVEAAAAAAGGAAEDEPRAVAEAGTEEPSGVTTTTDRSTLTPRPTNWRSITNTQKRNWWNEAKGKWR